MENFGRWNHREKPRWVTSDSQWPVEHAEIELKGRGEHVENPASDQDGKQPSATPRGVVTVTSKFGKVRVGWRLLTIIWYFHFTTQFHYVLIDYLPFIRLIPLKSIAQGFFWDSFCTTFLTLCYKCFKKARVGVTSLKKKMSVLEQIWLTSLQPKGQLTRVVCLFCRDFVFRKWQKSHYHLQILVIASKTFRLF